MELDRKQLSAIDQQLQVFELLSTWGDLGYTKDDFEAIINPIITTIAGDESMSINDNARDLRDYYYSMWLTARAIRALHSHTQDYIKADKEKAGDGPTTNELIDDELKSLKNNLKRLSFSNIISKASRDNYFNDKKILKEMKDVPPKEFYRALLEICGNSTNLSVDYYIYYYDLWTHIRSVEQIDDL
jgi:hypothetical protein